MSTNKPHWLIRLVLLLLSIPASGALFALSLPRADLRMVAAFCFIPVLLAARGWSFTFGFVAGLSSCLFSAWLISLPWTDIPGDPGWVYYGFALLAVVTGIICGVFGVLKKSNAIAFLGLASLAVLMEAAMMLILPVNLGLTQYRSPFFLMLASATGIWGVSFVLWLSNLWIAALLLSAEKKRLLGAAAWLVFLGLEGFAFRFALGSLPGEDAAAMQTDSMEQEDLWRLHKSALRDGLDVVVWPEVSAMQVAPAGNTSALIQLSQETGRVGFVTTFQDAATPMPHNTAALFSHGREWARYHKRKPFGSEKNMHQAGTAPSAAGITGFNICYDSCFPYIIRETARLPSVGYIALPTHDPEAPNAAASALHAAYTPFRAAESGVGIVRAETNAFSMIVDSTGQIVAEASHGEQIIYGNVGRARTTLYKLVGDWFLYFCGAGYLAWIFLSVRARRQPSREPA